MKRKSLVLLVIILIFTNVTLLFLPYNKADAATKRQGLIIADKNGGYTFYDLNNTDGKAGIETTSKGNVMVPLWKMTKLMPGLTIQLKNERSHSC